MINLKHVTLALTLALAAAAVATPALAKSPAPHHSGYNARAQAIEQGVEGMSPHRVDALRDCNAVAAQYRQGPWGVSQTTRYRVCMDEHGEME